MKRQKILLRQKIDQVVDIKRVKKRNEKDTAQRYEQFLAEVLAPDKDDSQKEAADTNRGHFRIHGDQVGKAETEENCETAPVQIPPVQQRREEGKNEERGRL